jgi:hypothetical protein
MRKILIILICLVVVVGAGYWYYAFVYMKNNHRSVENEKAVTVSATDLLKAYQTNEPKANTDYLNKAVSVNGVVQETTINQDGQTAVLLKTEDAFAGVFCTLTIKDTTIATNSIVTIKGICIGYSGDVKLKDAILVK